MLVLKKMFMWLRYVANTYLWKRVMIVQSKELLYRLLQFYIDCES